MNLLISGVMMKHLLFTIATVVVLAASLGLAMAGPEDAVDAPDGFALYARHCSGCHNSIGSTTKPGRQYRRISSAIKYNIGGMNKYSFLTADEITAISTALSYVEPPEDATGEELYEMYCASCHRPIDETDVKGKGVEDIKAAMSVQMCQTVNLKFLSETNIGKISSALTDAEH